MEPSRRSEIGELVEIQDDSVVIQLRGFHHSFPLASVRKSNGTACVRSNLIVGCPLQLTLEWDEVVEVTISPNYLLQSSAPFLIAKRPDIQFMQKPTVSLPPVSASLQAQFSAPVLHYSKQIFPLAVLANEYSHSQNTQAVFSVINTKCVGTRKSSAGDCDGVYLILAIAYIEHLARRTTPREELTAFQLRIGRCKGAGCWKITRELEELEKERREGRSGMRWMQEQSRNSDFWRQVKLFLKQFTAESSAKMSLSAEESAEEVSLKVLAVALNLKITLYSTEVGFLTRKYCTEEVGQTLAYLYLFRKDSLYHILYSQAQLDSEGYDLAKGSFCLIPAPFPYKTLLYCTTKQRYQFYSRVLEYQEEDKASSRRLIAFHQAAENYIARLMTLVERKEAKRPKAFYSQQLATSTLEFMHEFTRANEQLQTFDQNLTQKADNFVTESLYILKNSPLKSIFDRKDIVEQLNLCWLCQTRSGEVELDCRHAYCRECIEGYVEEMKGKMGFVLKPNEETVEGFVCPSMHCFIHISAGRLKGIMGEGNYGQYLSVVQQRTGMQSCQTCTKTRPLSLFQPICPCSSAICVLCYSYSLRLGANNCNCGLFLSTEAVNRLERLSMQCRGCKLTKSIKKDFKAVECEGHILCEDCLSLQMQQNGCCSVCFRVFSAPEINYLEENKPVKECFYCQKEYGQRRLNTACGCLICEPCATISAKFSGNLTLCPVCKADLPSFGYNQLAQGFTPTSSDPKQCEICNMCIEENTGRVLPCGEEFHQSCIERYFGRLIETEYSNREFPCPNATCMRGKFDSYEIQPYVSQTAWKRYCLRSMTRCPKCKTEITIQDRNEGRKINLFCPNPNCGFIFCVTCEGRFTIDHDEKACRFNTIQTQIENMALINEAGEVITQCPNCKNPYYKGSNEDLHCTVASCKARFCAQCSTPSFLYEVHGSAWHRPACPRYSPGERRGGRNTEKCKACREKGILCVPPKDLRVRGRFALEEY